MTDALSDLTRDQGSLVEALDDPGSPAAYSFAGYGRMSALAAELRALRAHAGRAAGGARHGGRADARTRRRGGVAARCRPGRGPSRPGRVRRRGGGFRRAMPTSRPSARSWLTWSPPRARSSVWKPGRSVTPTRSSSPPCTRRRACSGPRSSCRGWPTGPHRHLFPARPQGVDQVDRQRPAAAVRAARRRRRPAGPARSDRCRAHRVRRRVRGPRLAEERRLGYVAATRAAYLLGCCGHWWSDGPSRLGPSRFLAGGARGLRGRRG